MMGRNVKDMIGQRFGHLVVVNRAIRRNPKGQAFWLCKCDCGSMLVVRGDNLRFGISTQCSKCSGKGKMSDFVKGGDENGTI